MHQQVVEAAQVFKALGDPVRWNIVEQIAAEKELPYSVLEETLSVSKPTISYHTKILSQAGIIDVHKRGRNYFYSLRWETLGDVIDVLHKLAPTAVPTTLAEVPARRRRKRPQTAAAEPTLKLASGDDGARPITLLTW